MRRTGIATAVIVTAAMLVAAVPSAPLSARVPHTASGARPGLKGHWDRRLVPIAEKVESLRGLRFKRAVPARFLSDAKFRKEVTRNAKDLTKKEKADIAQAEAEMRAYGLIDSSVKLLDAVNEVSASGVLAFYDPDTKKITIRGTKLDAATRVTVAHELTHGLQDQYFDLNKLEKKAKSSGASAALRALIEGDASRVEDDYASRLSAADQRAYDATRQEQAKQADTPSPGHPAPPEIVEALFGAPYVLGPTMVETILTDGGDSAVDDAFRHPPKTEEQFFNPATLITTEKTVKVRLPKLHKGEKRVVSSDEQTDFGAFSLYLVLASRIDKAQALDAADGWGGDATITYKKGKAVCVRTTFAGQDDAATTRLDQALRAWAGAMPGGTVNVSSGDTTTTVDGCDAGARTVAPPNSANDALQFAAARGQVFVSALSSGESVGVSECIATRIVRAPEFDELVKAEEAGTGASTDLQSRAQALGLRLGTECAADPTRR